MWRMVTCATFLGLVVPIGSVRSAVRSRIELEIPRPVPSLFERKEHYPASSDRWHWVYQGVARAQSFVAAGVRVESLRLRVARLNRNRTQAPLEVEIRDSQLHRVYLRGQIDPNTAEDRFHWVDVQLHEHVPLERRHTYVLLLHSRNTRHDAPWLLNAVFSDAYDEGRHLGYQDDLFLSISFSCGSMLHVGPPSNAIPNTPFNSGLPAAKPMPTRPTLRFGGLTCPPIALSDPLGPLPPGEKVEVKVEMAP